MIRGYTSLLRTLYIQNDYPSDRLMCERSHLEAFTKELNRRAHMHFTAEEVADELKRLRKDKSHTGGLPRLGRSFRGPNLN